MRSIVGEQITAAVPPQVQPLRVGLHGHPFGQNIVRAAAAEGVGTFILVFSIISAVIAASLALPISGVAFGSLSVAVAGGLALALSVATLGHVSGAHLNPAVTVALAVNRRFPLRHIPAYVAAQLTGAVTAALGAWALFGERARTVAHLGAPGPSTGVSVWQLLGAEGIVTFILVLGVVSVATDNRVPAGVAAWAIGAALAVAIIASGPISGAGVNPARSLGPMIVAGTFTDWWVYVTGPLVGGAIAATVYEVLRSGSVPTTSRFGESTPGPTDDRP
jgi:aquaporin Z/aquaporin NIP